jgi:peptide/nickel transport system permease protein
VIHGVLLLIAASILCFAFGALAPGDFFDEMKLNPQISQATIAALRSQYGIDQPIPLRYASWVKSVLRGEWGYSFAYNCPVRSLLMARARNTLLLTTAATFLAWLIALPLGVWMANRRGRWSDRLSLAGTSLLLSIPELVIALLLLYWVTRTRALPAGGMVSVSADGLSTQAMLINLASHLVVPTATLVFASLPLLVRHIRASMIEVLRAPFVQAARAHGIGRTRLLFRYALPAAANPLCGLLGLSVGGLLSGSLLVEVITAWPGLGPLLLEAAIGRDIYVVVGAVMASTFFMIAGSILADILLVAFDPRIRLGEV